uniref:Uncharacterized protein n=1 Tax=Rhizophora mucronata TaxID=61149 RepID=A0A2P2N9Q9_RHIMU
MGNCMRPSTQRRNKDADMEAQRPEVIRKENGDFKKCGVKIKIVLTKEELEFLTLRLQVNGEKKIDDVLREIEEWREKGKVWKPSLESIAEIPEGLEVER